MSSAINTFNPAFGSPEQIIAANTRGPESALIDHAHRIDTVPIIGETHIVYRNTLAYGSPADDQLQQFLEKIPSVARGFDVRNTLSANDYAEARNTVNALQAVATPQNQTSIIKYLAANIEVAPLALEVATAANKRNDVDRVLVEIEEDPESSNQSLFVIAVVSTEDFNEWDAIDQDILGSIIAPHAATNRARIVFSIAHADSL